MGLTPSDWCMIRLYQRNLTEVQKKCLPTMPTVYVPCEVAILTNLVFFFLLINSTARQMKAQV